MCGCVRWIKSEFHDALESKDRGGKDSKDRGGYVDD